ncbi:MAG: hypothetical protein Q8S55_09585 [Methylococcaceae bacterium]|nr:hypothetical protein [Methylococcaceae bacterium]
MDEWLDGRMDVDLDGDRRTGSQVVPSGMLFMPDIHMHQNVGQRTAVALRGYEKAVEENLSMANMHRQM